MAKKPAIWILGIIVLAFAFTCSGKNEEARKDQAETAQAASALGQESAEDPGSGLIESMPAKSDREEAFAFIRDSIRTEASRYPLKTAEGIRWGRSGNSLEKALLLAQILQDGGETVQVVEGELDDTEAKNLLGSIFPAAESFNYGADVPVSAPAEDPNLISAVKRHFWVQVETGDGWLDLDPSFPAAKPGRAFASVKETYDPADESLRTRLTVSLECEVGDSGEPESVLSWEGGMEEVANQPLSLSIVAEFQPVAQEEEEEGEATGGVFGALGGKTSKSNKSQAGETTVYNAALTVRGEGIADGRIAPDGEPVSQLVLRFKFESGDEVISESERLLFKKTGKDGVPPLFQRHAILITGNRIPAEAWQDKLESVSDQSLLKDVKARVEEIKKNLKAKKITADTLEKSADLEERLGPELGHLLTMIFASTSDDQSEKEGAALSVASYYLVPRILICSFGGDQQTSQVDFDLRQDRIEAVPLPGQALVMKRTFLYGRGVIESILEGTLLGKMTGKPALTTAAMMQEASKREISVRSFSALEKDAVAGLGLPEHVIAKIASTLDSGRVVIIPEKSVNWGGRERWGWWDVDPGTMETIGVMDSGLHQAMVQRTILDTKNPLHEKMGFVIGAITGAVDTQWMIAGMILEYGEINKAALLEAKAYMKELKMLLCPGFEKKVGASVGVTLIDIEDCWKKGLEVGVEAGIKIEQGWCKSFAEGFACASTQILNYYLSDL